jgi:membrane-associated phospholipid phosphatase
MKSSTRLWLGAASIALLAAAMTVDSWTYHHIRFAEVYEKDWGRLLRIVGYWPTWIVLGIAAWMERRRAASGLTLILGTGVSGLAAEVVKLLVRRGRPGIADGSYIFRSFAVQPFSTKDVGFPSSHAAVAFAGAAAASYLFPGAAPVWYALAIGCGITRILAGAHFLSDVIGGALVGILVGTAVSRALARREAPAAGEPLTRLS